MIDPKDRGQLLRMAGNIACGLIERNGENDLGIPELAAQLALATLKEVDKLIVEENKE